MELPRFNKDYTVHVELALLVEQTHQEHDHAARQILVQRIAAHADTVLGQWMKTRRANV